ncbi:MAG: insulinase family protein [Oscillospiraceae bacterium]
MEVTERILLPGVTLTAVQTHKFKSAVLSLTLFAPLNAETAALNALIPSVLRRGTAKYPDMQALSAVLDDLYGGSIEPMVRKKGETQCVGFVSSFLDDAYTPDGSKILEPAAALLGDLLLRPVTEQGKFQTEYVAQERENLIARIEGQKNDKRHYSITRLTQLMCEGEHYAVDAYGDGEQAAKITPESLWAQYQTLLAQSELNLYYCGSANIDRVAAALTEALRELPRDSDLDFADCEVRCNRGTAEPRVFTDEMDVAQGKLSMGFRTGGICIGTKGFPALLVLNDLYGGSTNSKLFLNVREKLSLCYYASSMLEKIKGLMIVSSGVEFSNFDKARDEILAQFGACQAGNITEEELAAARRSVVSELRATLDGQGRLENHYLTFTVGENCLDPETLAAQVEGVTMEQVVAVAQQMELDSIYYLTGKEAQ